MWVKIQRFLERRRGNSRGPMSSQSSVQERVRALPFVKGQLLLSSGTLIILHICANQFIFSKGNLNFDSTLINRPLQ